MAGPEEPDARAAWRVAPFTRHSHERRSHRRGARLASPRAINSQARGAFGGGRELVRDEGGITCECPKSLRIIYFTVLKMVTFIHLNTKLMKRSIQPSLKFSIHAHCHDPLGPHLGPCHGVLLGPLQFSGSSGRGQRMGRVPGHWGSVALLAGPGRECGCGVFGSPSQGPPLGVSRRRTAPLGCTKVLSRTGRRPPHGTFALVSPFPPHATDSPFAFTGRNE